ncbi:MAG: adenylate/guanylate cyclase domain-containing protein [Alphaproteobacteria bacterium]
MATDTVIRKLAAVAAADVVGYSRLMEGDEAGTLARLKSARADVIDRAVAGHGGRIVKTTGDGMLVEFASAVAAAQWALAVQVALAAREPERQEDERIALRIGLNLGDVILDGDDIYGDGVNVAARLEALAPPGGIAVSGAVQEQIHGKVDAEFVDAGEHHVKNITRPLKVWTWRLAPDPGAATASMTAADDDGERPSIVVLPFVDMGGGADQEWFADGITEEIITGLARLPGFLVIARNSAFTYKGRAVNVSEIVRELGVRYVLEGSVRAATGRLRITAQLIDGATSQHIWADKFEGEPTDVFALQDEITRKIISTIQPEIIHAENTRLRAAPARTLAAWECITRGTAHYWRWTRHDFAEAERLTREAIALEPDNAEALALLALTRWGQAISGFVRPGAPAMAESLEMAKRAVAANHHASHARMALGTALMGVERPDEAMAEIERAVESDPGSSEVLLMSGLVNAYIGSPELAIEHSRASLRLNPRDPMVYARYQNMGFAHFALGQYAEALDCTRRVKRVLPEWTEAWTLEIACLALLDQMDDARRAAGDARHFNPQINLAYVARRHPYRNPSVRARLIEALRNAGIPETATQASN